MTKEGVWLASKRFALVVLPAVAAYVTQACPTLFSYSGLVAIGGGLLAGISSFRKSQTAGTAVVHGAAGVGMFGALYLAAQQSINQLCGTGFVEQLPTLVTTGFCLALAAYMHGTTSEVKG